MSVNAHDIEALIQSQAALIDELRARVHRLEASGPGPVLVAAAPARLPSSEVRSMDDDETLETSSRRGFLRLAGAAAAGAAVAAVANAAPAAALDGGTYSGSETVFTNSTSTDPTKSGVKGTFTTATVSGIGVLGQSDTTSAAAGVVGSSIAGYGVYGSAGTGYALYAGSNGRLGFDSHLNGTAAPTTGGYKLGDIVMNAAGDTFSCVVAGSGGSAKFRKLAGAGTAGQLHLLSSALRLYDSRNAGDGGRYSSGSDRLVDASSVAPAGAGGLLISLLVFDNPSPGFIGAYRDGAAYSGTINAFWTANCILANTTVVGLSSARAFRLHSTVDAVGPNVAVDVLGYYL